MAVAPSSSTAVACGFLLRGLVQGQGVRPTVVRMAVACGVTGGVRNTSDGVQIDAFGDETALSRFEKRLSTRFDTVRRSLDSIDGVPEDFTIRPSTCQQTLTTIVPPDLAVCENCLDDIRDPTSRRYQYPFTSCVDCGPRYSILHRMPYDRANTSMDPFSLCEECEMEYRDPSDRRFHAQTIACPQCGPMCWASDADGAVLDHGSASIARVASLVREGRIAAIKGLGGYQLVCDATNDRTIRLLRQRKMRPAKPLPVMAMDLSAALELAEIGDAESRVLASPENPIVLLRQRQRYGMSDDMNPGLGDIGILLPTTPMHWLLALQVRRPMVVTSGNRSGRPLAFDEQDAIRQLRNVADVWLHHNRDIVRPIDDSVVQVIGDREMTFRAARGIAPITMAIPQDIQGCSRFDWVAVGGHQKVSLAVNTQTHFVLGPHLGDLESEEMRVRFCEQTESFRQLYHQPDPQVAADLHPDYFTGQWARTSYRRGAECSGVQHHLAHVASAMLDQGISGARVLGFSFDGTGFGSDGTIWGGEVFRGTSAELERIAHLRTFRLPGGDLAVKQPWRVAISLLSEICESDEVHRWLGSFSRETNPDVFRHAIDKAVATSSMGRLFDGVAALVLGFYQCSYEAEPAMRLEAIADRSEPGCYEFSLLKQPGCPIEFNWHDVIASILEDLPILSAGRIAMKFHRAVAKLVIDLAEEHERLPVVLSGGVFQNRLLLECLVDAARSQSIDLRLPGRLPVNDGGLCMGQLLIAHLSHSPSESPSCA